MTTFAYAILTVSGPKWERFEWRVMGSDDTLAEQRLEDEVGPKPFDWQHQTTMVGARGWELIQLVDRDGAFELWFKRDDAWRTSVPDVVDQ